MLLILAASSFLLLREVLNTLRYQARSGCQWDMLPHDLLPKSTVYDYFAQWRDDGTWQRIVDALRPKVRVAAGRQPTPGSPTSTARRSKPPRTIRCQFIIIASFASSR